MPPEDLAAAQGGGNNSSDFVRKLYKMLEDPQYSHVVRWGNEGDSFVVLENEKFTKTILPKHFKHSNFASFVRQLNKYDFHKVRHNEENGQSPYGPGAWEFKHPEFRADRKDNLDSIRRKAPAPRKGNPTEESFPASQQVVLLNDQLIATQHQVQSLQEQFFELSQANRVLVNEVVSLQKMVKAQSSISNEVLTHLSHTDERRRSSRHSGHSSQSSHSPAFQSATMGLLPDGADEPPPELRRARQILDGLVPDVSAERDLERLSMAFHQTGSPADSAGSSSAIFPQGTAAPLQLVHDPLNEMRHMVYPVGQNTGIDPFHADHIQNIPYSRPLSNPDSMPEPVQESTPPKEMGGLLWGPKKPRILLVEDDKTCSRIGSKFLSAVDCAVDVAKDGSKAVNMVNSAPDRYDLIFMDIIMPVLDGVSATALIRMVNQRVPLVAMTSNIRQEDIATYFHWGMNDVLAKPFTKDGMIRILKKCLPFLLKNPPPPGTSVDEMSSGSIAPGTPGSVAGYSSSGMNMAPMTGPSSMVGGGGGPAKFESTPIQSPSTTGSWHSPGQMTHTSPTLDGGGYMAQQMSAGPPIGQTQSLVMKTGGPQHQQQRSQYAGMPQMGGPGMGRLPDDDRPDKRQRLYGPASGGYP